MLSRGGVFYYYNHYDCYYQKHSSEGVFEKRCSGKFHKIHRKATLLESLFNKVADLRHVTLLKRDSSEVFPCEFDFFKRNSVKSYIMTIRCNFIKMLVMIQPKLYLQKT